MKTRRIKIPARSLLLTFLLCALPASATAQAINPSLVEWGAAVNDLRIGVALTNPGAKQTQPVVFDLAFQNVGNKDTILDLGTMLEVQYPMAVHLILTDDQNHSRELQLIGPAAVSGVIHDFAVPLSSGATYVLRLTLKQFYTTATYGTVSALAPGHYHLMAKFENTTEMSSGGMPLIYWTGSVHSNPIDFTVGK